MDLELPPELLCTPLPLVSFVGLSPNSFLWTKFCSNRGLDRVPLRVSEGEDLRWPNMKPKRNTYEWFIPKGILKRNWMSKHLYDLPSVVVVFMELDWNEANFNEKKMECSTRVQTVRQTLAGRSTKLAVVLLQKNFSLPTSEDIGASERASALCSACELSNRSLFVLPVSHENLDGYIVRLENAFYELAQNYYHQEIRGVKSHRDYLNKTTHLYLFVRHQFKAGFLNELKRDFHAAYKHYGQAYSLLMEVRATDTNIMEVKTVAGFISYKICKLAFRLNLPRDAISQFRKHMDIFQQKVGSDGLEFEHKGWQAKQCEVFADTFDEAIKNGLPAIQTQHPGLYYQQAAQYSIARREIVEERNLDQNSYPSPDPLLNIENMEFYGQRPWRPGTVSLEPPDINLEKSGILALLHHDKFNLNHSENIINLLEKSISQFRSFKSPRSECHLKVTMAEELKSAQRYREALDLLKTVMVHYRKEKWRSLLDAVICLALKCAFLICDASEYIRLSLDICSKESEVGEEEKVRVVGNLFGLFSGKIPAAETGLTSKSERLAVGKATVQWTQLVEESKRNPVQVQLESQSSCIDFKSSFNSNMCKADEQISLDILVRNGTAFTITISKLLVRTSSKKNYNLCWIGTESVQGNSFCKKSFSFLPFAEDVEKLLTVKMIECQIGHEDGFKVLIHKTVETKAEIEAIQRFFFVPQEKFEDIAFSDETDSSLSTSQNKPIFSTVEIQQREPLMKMEVNFQAPILIGEWFEIAIELENLETESDAENVEVGAELTDASDPLISDTTRLSFDKSTLNNSQPMTPGTPINEEFNFTHRFEVGILKKNGTKSSTSLFVKASTAGMRGVRIQTSYKVKTQEGIECQSKIEETLNLDTIEPFQLSTEQKSLRFQPIENAFTDEVFFLLPMLESNSPHVLEIVNTFLELRQPFQLESRTESQLTNCPLYPRSQTMECYPVISKHSDLMSSLDIQELSLGKYVIQWSRKDQKDLINETQLDLPSIKLQVNGLTAFADMPAYGVVRTPLNFTYILTNHTEKVQEFYLEVETSETFMVSGHKQIHFKITPMSDYILNYVLYPLIAGERIPLPPMTLSSTRISQVQDVNQVLERMLPKTLTVLPKARTENEAKLNKSQQRKVENKDNSFYEVVEPVIVKMEPLKTGTKSKVVRAN